MWAYRIFGYLSACTLIHGFIINFPFYLTSFSQVYISWIFAFFLQNGKNAIRGFSSMDGGGGNTILWIGKYDTYYTTIIVYCLYLNLFYLFHFVLLISHFHFSTKSEVYSTNIFLEEIHRRRHHVHIKCYKF